MSVCIEQGQLMKMFGDETDKPAGSPLPTLSVLRTPAEVVSARASELLDINQLLQGPLKGVLAEKTAAVLAETRFVCVGCNSMCSVPVVLHDRLELSDEVTITKCFLHQIHAGLIFFLFQSSIGRSGKVDKSGKGITAWQHPSHYRASATSLLSWQCPSY